MDFQAVIDKLDYHAKAWASTLTQDDLSIILSAVYRVPGLINALKTPIGITTPNAYLGAAEIGKKGEAEFERICQKLPGQYNVINTAKLGKQGDFIIECRVDNKLYRCLVDIKNYKTTVPRKEIDKFYEDMTYGSYEAGLMISYTTKFTGVGDSVFIENKELPYSRVPIMYLSEISFDLILKCIEVLFLKVQITQEKQTTYSQLESSIMFINTSLQQSASTRRMLSELNNTMSTQIQRCQENLIGLEVQIKQAIKHIDSKIKSSDVVPLDNALNGTLESKCEIPQLPQRADNVEECDDKPNSNLVVLDKLDIVDEKVDKKISNICGTTSGILSTDSQFLLDYGYSVYCNKDIKLIQQLAHLPVWDAYTTEGNALVLISSDFTVHLAPLKTKTKITLYNISDENIIKLKKLLAVFSNKKNVHQFIADLSQKIIDEIATI